ncbi:MAG: GatB/YqeY domain-containing protein, partial [Flavobacteriaceae bacterium]|nr:GatB/YqeY domain-containing protein [Flavobacteriaceae bacterium]
EIENEVKKVIDETGAEGMKDMGKVMGIVTKKLMGKADGKTISTIVRNNLN